jgi:hypothetical protein
MIYSGGAIHCPISRSVDWPDFECQTFGHASQIREKIDSHLTALPEEPFMVYWCNEGVKEIWSMWRIYSSEGQ